MINCTKPRNSQSQTTVRAKEKVDDKRYPKTDEKENEEWKWPNSIYDISVVHIL